MALIADPLSVSTTFGSLPKLRFGPVEEDNEYPKGLSHFIPPPGFSPRASDDEQDDIRDLMFDFMTNPEGCVMFNDTISDLKRRHVQKLASILTSDSDYFAKIVGDKIGSLRVQMLFGKYDDVDGFFCTAILRSFLNIMTHQTASYVALQAMAVFDKQKKEAMYKYLLHHASDLARDPHGCVALSQIMTNEHDPYYRDKLLPLVFSNATTTHDVAVNLRGHYVDLSFKKYGSYIVEHLLEASQDSAFLVGTELLECEGERLLGLARNRFGSRVVVKALRVTQQKHMFHHLFCGLVEKLMPFLHLLRNSCGRQIANILDTLV